MSIPNPRPHASSSPDTPLDSEPGTDMFLTTRVIDCEAYGDFAGALKALVAQANGSVDDLAAQKTIVDSLREELEAAAAQHQGQITLSSRLLKTIEAKLHRYEESAHLIDQRLNYLEQVEANCREQVAATQKDLDALVKQACEKVRTEISDLDKTRAVLEDLQSQAARIDEIGREKLEDLKSHAQADVTSIQTMFEQTAEQAMARVVEDEQQLRAGIESVRKDLKSEIELWQEHKENAEDYIEGVAAQIETSTQDSLKTINETCNARLDLIEARLNQREAEIDSRDLSIRQIVEQVDETRQEFEELLQLQAEGTARLEAMLSKLGPWQTLLNDTNVGELPEPARAVLNNVQDMLDQELDAFADSLSLIAQQANDLAEARQQARANPTTSPTTDPEYNHGHGPAIVTTFPTNSPSQKQAG